MRWREMSLRCQLFNGLLNKEFLGSNFTIWKEWKPSKDYPIYYLNNRKLDREEYYKIDQFLQLIKFRYIPNRVLPIDLIKNEHRELRDVLIDRISKRAKEDQEAFQAIQDVSLQIISELSQRFKNACPGVGSIRLATPLSWRDMAFAFGYRISSGNVEIEDIYQGSGIQSLLMLETLLLIDQHPRFKRFGWRQATIWAIEEPESSLHSSLEAYVAQYLSTISSHDGNRLQVIATTHSDLMVQYSDDLIVSEISNGQSSFKKVDDKKQGLDILSKAGISRWVHPILHFPLDPLILVDGKYDQAFWEEAFRFIKPKKEVRVTYLEEISSPDRTGGSDLLNYIKENVQVIKSRRSDAPVILVLDWDASNKKTEIERRFSAGDPFKVLLTSA